MWPATRKSLRRGREGEWVVAGEGAFEIFFIFFWALDENTKMKFWLRSRPSPPSAACWEGKSSNAQCSPCVFRSSSLGYYPLSPKKSLYNQPRGGNSPSFISKPRRASGAPLPALRAATLRGGKSPEGAGGPEPARGDQSRAGSVRVSQ